MKSHKIDRRTLLRGMLGGVAVSIGLPTLDAMLNAEGTALANGGAIPKRFGVFYWGGGIIHDAWVPQDTGRNWTLSPSLQERFCVRRFQSLSHGRLAR